MGMIAAFVLLGASIASAQGVVTDAAIAADPSYLQSHLCPVTVVFNGHISANGPAKVTYRIVRSDGATGPINALYFEAAGSQPVTTTWTLGDALALPSYGGWVAIEVLSPNAVSSNKADASFTMTCGAAPPPTQPQRARFRVSLTGFQCNRETRDNLLELDGPGDEVYQAPFVVIVERGGPTIFSIGAHGPIFGGIHTGTGFPTATPSILASDPVGLGIPGILFEGELVEGERAVAIAPALWEYDGPNTQLLNFWAACSIARDRIAGVTIPIMTGAFPARYGGLGTALDGLITTEVAREGDLDRPIGIDITGGTATFSPKFILLTYEGAMARVRAASFRGDVFAIGYSDPESHQGNYTLFVKVEQVP
jgi:hypothetical protein